MKRLVAGLVVAVFALAACTEAQQTQFSQQQKVKSSQQALTSTFATGSLIIPMDAFNQGGSTLRAYGLVYELLKAGVPVYWMIKEGKEPGGVDFTASTRNITTLSLLPFTQYKGGSFVIDSAFKTQAMAVITPWSQSILSTTVHEATAPFTAESKTVLYAAPKIAIFANGAEDKAFAMLNAAGITDSRNNAWPVSIAGSYTNYPDVLNTAQLKGATSGTGADGALSSADGTPSWNFFATMHADTADTEVVREVRQFLQGAPLSQAYMQCNAVTSFENDANGRFLTTAGLQQETDTLCVTPLLCVTSNRGAPLPVFNRKADSMWNQADGLMTLAGGDLQSIGLKTGSVYRSNVDFLLSGAASGNTRMAWINGRMDGAVTNGHVSYLAGHEYSLLAPLISNPFTQGARLFLNALFATGIAGAEGQPSMALVKSGPARTTASVITWTLAYANSGPGTASSVVLEDTLPAGVTMAGSNATYTQSGSTVKWAVGNVKSGQGGTVTVSVNVNVDATFSNTAKLSWKVGNTGSSLNSNTVSTSRDATAPETSITALPPALTNSTNVSVSFQANEPSTFECRIDAAAFAACTSPFTASFLSEGHHVFAVRATDTAGNRDDSPETAEWTIDITPPLAVSFTQPGEGATVTSRPLINGLAEGGSTVALKIDNVVATTVVADAASGAWQFQVTSAMLSGAHTATATATDAAGNVSPVATRHFTVDMLAPEAPFITSPANGSTINTQTPVISGTATTGTTVRVYSDNVLLGVSVAVLGVWSYPVTLLQSLSEGPHRLSAVSVSLTNVVSAEAVSNIIVDLTAPTTPVITFPTDGGITNSPDVTVKADVELNALCVVLVDGLGIPGITLGVNGQISVPLTNLTDGTHVLVTICTDQGGNQSPPSPIITFIVDTIAPNAPVILTPADAQRFNTARPAITGTAELLSTVEVFIDGVSVGTTPATLGLWSFTPPSDLSEGEHHATARSTDLAGNRSVESNTRTFFIDVTGPGACVLLVPADGSFTNNLTPTYAGTAEPSSTVTVTVDSLLVGTVLVDAQGDWRFTQLLPMIPGAHSARCMARDDAGNAGPTSAPNVFTIDIIAPAAPVIVTPASGDFTTSTVTISGTAEALSTLTLSIDESTVAFVQVDAAGTWSFTASGLGTGIHSTMAWTTDRAGNISLWSNIVGFTVVGPQIDAGFDAGQPEVDAGQPETDAGQPEVDAGQPEVDAGTDAGQPEVDAGQPQVDAGQPEVDAGQPATDAGQPQTDAGQPGHDGGAIVILIDGGMVTVDGGPVTPFDAGAPVTDAGNTPDDGGINRQPGDAGTETETDGGVPTFDFQGGGCGCNTGSFDPSWFGLVGGLLFLRRRAKKA